MSGKKRRASEQRLARIRLLSTELDNLRLNSMERTRSIDSKASFAVVAAGVIAAAAFDSLSSSHIWIAALIPVSLTVATVVVAAIALWPYKLKTPSAREVVDQWVEADLAPSDLENNLLEVKAKEITFRNSKNEDRARATKWAYALLVTSLVATLATVGINSAISNGDSTDGQTRNTPTPAHSRTP